ncbi:MAG: extracellular solute-binding protein, partial [Victivallales bacterium]
MPRIKNNKKTRFGYHLAIDAINEYIVKQGYASGDLLPSLKDLADTVFNGKIKQVRMAVAQLVKDGILESQKGRGVFVKNASLAKNLFRSQNPEALSGMNEVQEYEIGMPHILREMPKISISLIERGESFRGLWEEIIAAFNADNHDFQVETVFSKLDTPPTTDLFQVQSFRMRPFIDNDLVYDLRVSVRGVDKYFPSLLGEVMGKDRLWGVPVTAVAYCIVANEAAFERQKLSIPDAWDTFEDYVEYLQDVTARLGRRKSADRVVYNSFGIGYYLMLAGKLKEKDSFKTLDFSSNEITRFLNLFGKVYCDPSCFYRKPVANSANSIYEPNIDAKQLLLETHTYNITPAFAAGNRCRYIAPPVNKDGHCPIVPHYICVSRHSHRPDQSIKLLNHLISQRVAQFMVNKGFVIGRTDVEGFSPALRKTLEKGCAEPWRTETENRLLSIINNNFYRWQQHELSLRQACENIRNSSGG